MSKKAITPLISTILLIAFAIGLGTLVMSWGNSQKIEDVSCNQVQMEVTSLSAAPQLCYSDDSVSVILENNGKLPIKKVEAIFLMEDNLIKTVFQTDILPGEFKKISFSPGAVDFTKVLKIRLIPYSSVACIDKRFELEGISPC